MTPNTYFETFSCNIGTCSPNPCKNNGTCEALSDGFVKECRCAGNFVGVRCEYQGEDLILSLVLKLQMLLDKCALENNSISLSSTSDAYTKLDGTFCLRREQVKVKKNRVYSPDGFADRDLDIIHAKEECSKNQRCVGIERRPEFFNLCLDSIYTSTAFDKYKTIENYVYKKMQNYGTYSHNFTKYMNIEIGIAWLNTFYNAIDTLSQFKRFHKNSPDLKMLPHARRITQKS